MSGFMFNPKISVIVPIYNVSSNLKEALESLKNQTFKEMEILLVNDASTDDSVKIAKEFLTDKRFSLINKSINEGLSSARNTGIKFAKGDWVYFFDSDDKLPINLFEILSKFFDKDIDMISFNYCDLVPGLKKINTFQEKGVYSNVQAMDMLIENRIEVAPWSYICKRSILENNSSIRFPISRNFEDISYNVKLINKVNKLLVLSCSPGGYFYRAGRPNSISNDIRGRKLKKQIDDKLYLNDFKYKFLCRNKNLYDLDKINKWYFLELINLYLEYYPICKKNDISEYNKLFTKIRQQMLYINSNSKILTKLKIKEKIKYYLIMHSRFLNLYFKIKNN